MTRYIYGHLLNRDRPKPGEPVALGFLGIAAIDAPGAGGANHIYELRVGGPDDATYDSFIFFQNGTIAENGVNGVTEAALMAIIIDRLESFQEGPFACEENAAALNYANHTLHWLHQRTRRRLDQNIEGQHVELKTIDEHKTANLAAAEAAANHPNLVLYNEEQKAIKDSQEREQLISEGRSDELPENQKGESDGKV